MRVTVLNDEGNSNMKTTHDEGNSSKCTEKWNIKCKENNCKSVMEIHMRCFLNLNILGLGGGAVRDWEAVPSTQFLANGNI